eukprot:GFUD01106007.1.p1 GENE.GFUD01106007.1~~GFUD01106007.1.p1  ORF type:complete len:120 (-),score=30.81 GFUD01106007.1:71-388(-)
MDSRLGLVAILTLLTLVQIDQAARIGRRDWGHEESEEEDTINRSLLKLFLTKTKQFKVEERNQGFSIQIKTKHLNKFLEIGKIPHKSNNVPDKNLNPEDSFYRIT